MWSEATIHAPGSTIPLLLGDSWSEHPRIRVELDKRHPIYAAHHQKIVSIDDEIAFVGGMDLTVDRWDTPDHETDCPLRVTPDGTPYDPVHDVQMIVEGEAAQALAGVLPVDRDEVVRMLGELRGAAVLAGARGTSPADLPAVADAVVRLAECARSLGPALRTVEVNPLRVDGTQVEALDVLVVTGTA